ncbi:wound-induced protein 1 [Phtheirospermum japonicum]|uniref:Wound-induced protein 1 n=1 Tax=Phtheirospermum japonicum TaxID=374723 RepID=A0A830D5Q0_9LAMI|nr:wound-induced protein 1 [Phtheirospermum japonicum]
MQTQSSRKNQIHPNITILPPTPDLNAENTLPTHYIKSPFHLPQCPTKHFLFLEHQTISAIFLSFSQELALSQEILEDSRTKGVVTALYDALSRRDAEVIQQILAPDLEWWFHGPPSHQYLMRLLTGEQESDGFRFVPHSIAAFGPTVLAEGFDQSRSIAWVHAWTVADGIITQVREYFNTSLTVTRIAELHCPSVWVSSLPDRVGKSVPGLVLAI